MCPINNKIQSYIEIGLMKIDGFQSLIIHNEWSRDCVVTIQDNFLETAEIDISILKLPLKAG